MLKNIQYKSIYRNLYDDFNRDFLIPSYRNSIEVFRASGFFTLDSLLLSFDGLFDFARHGGKMKLLCSPMLNDEDVQRIKEGKKVSEDLVIEKLLLEINSYECPDEIQETKLDIICNLIASDIIQLRIAFMEGAIYHEKFGIFTDEIGDSVYFNGSFNSTYNGSVMNSESIFVQTSWDRDNEFIYDEKKVFENVFNGCEEKVKVIEFSDACKNRLFTRFKKSESFDEASQKLIKRLSVAPIKKKTLYPYQEDAIEEFVKNNYCHFYEMATGTGKTFTAIRTIKRVYDDKDKVFVLILVPQTELQTQWINALKEDGFNNCYAAGGEYAGESDNSIIEATIDYINNGKAVIFVSLYDTFFEKYSTLLNRIENLFVIVDEAHNITPNYLEKLPKNAVFRLGLSATLERWSAKETKAIHDYFCGEKPSFIYGIEEAIDKGFLSHYEYHPIRVYLNDNEFAKYQQKTKSLAQAQSAEIPDEEEIQRLANERALILKQAENKIIKLNELVHSPEYNFKNSVIYCGQGKIGEDVIIDRVTKILNGCGNYESSQFTSKTINRKEVLAQFEAGYYDTLIAIKCFDEGVDVPKLDKIYVMASDGSRRQTVQRRGRVLRICKESGKEMAYIYDMVVLPPINMEDAVGTKSIIHNELIRMKEYTSLCDNIDIYDEIDSILNDYNLTEDLLDDEHEITD